MGVFGSRTGDTIFVAKSDEKWVQILVDFFSCIVDKQHL